MRDSVLPGIPNALTSPRLRWMVLVGASVMVAIGLVLLYMLTQATNSRLLYERNYSRLFAINMVVAVSLLAVVLWIGLRLWIRLRKGKFGSRLLVKLAAIFALVGFVPGVLIYVVSYQFVSRSIESWFDVQVEGALDAGLNLGRATLDAMSNDLAAKARSAAFQLSETPNASAGLVLEKISEQTGASDVKLWNASGQLLASVGQSRYQINPERPSATLLRQVRTQRVITLVEGLEDADVPVPVLADSSVKPASARLQGSIKALVVVNRAGFGLNDELRYLQITLALPETLVANALAVQEVNREYQERALARDGLRRMYIGTLTLSLFLAILGAVLLAVLLGNQLVRPLLVLADGVRQVALGDFTPKAALHGRDELGGLTRSFADMTQQLADARAEVEQSMGQVDAARAHLQTILDNLTAGVIVLDTQGDIQSVNPGATRILRAPLAAHTGRPLAGVPGLDAFAQDVTQQFENLLSERAQTGQDHWQHSFVLPGSPSGQGRDVITLVARGAELPSGMRLLVFDDISEIVSAQRAQAWSEVARRLAHEIKNPLTPIQLSAERLAMKLTGRVAEAEQATLNKSVKTIVDQVEAMKRLVNEFRDFGRLPVATLQPVDLNALLTELMQLYGEENAVVPVQLELDPGCPPIQGDAQQLRQVVHNLLQNAQDASEAALAAHPESSVPPVLIRTHWSASNARVRLSVLDQGGGFPEHILKRAFEPYVTTKAKGTGLGLAVVKKISDDHGARITLRNLNGQGGQAGAQVSLSFPVL